MYVGTNIPKPYTIFWACLCYRVEKITDMKLADKIYAALGACKQTDTIQMGLLASASDERLKLEVFQVLRDAGFPYEEALLVSRQAWHESEDILAKTTPVLVDPDTDKVSVIWLKQGHFMLCNENLKQFEHFFVNT